MLEWIKGHLLRNIACYVFIAFLVSMLAGSWLLYLEIITTPSDIIKYFGFTLTVFSVWLVIVQFRATRDWNKRQLAITTSKKVKDSTIEDVFVLNKAFDYLQLNTKAIISVDDIHKKICKKDDKGSLVRDGDGKYKVDDEGEGRQVKRAINNLLNDFEYLAVGVYQNVFDREIVKALYIGPMIKTYYNFKAYIEHSNNDMSPERRGKIWINFKTLAMEFEDEEKEESDKRKEASI